MHGQSKLTAFAALAAGVLAISWSAILVRWTHMPGVASAFYRVIIAAILFWLVLLVKRISLAHLTVQSILLPCLGGIFFAGDVGLYNVAVLRTAAGSATFLANVSPIFVGMLAWYATRKLPSPRFCTALAIAFTGAFLIVSMDFRRFETCFSADLLAILAAVCFASYLFITERARGKMDTAILVTLSTTASAISLFAFAAGTHLSLAVPDVSSLAALIGLGFICQFAGYFCLTYALGHLPATVTSIVLLGVAPLTAINAWIFFNERMMPLQLLGGGFILLAVWTVSRDPTTGRRDACKT
jgi:drug/metabolite transporter (DMT)-like permease